MAKSKAIGSKLQVQLSATYQDVSNLTKVSGPTPSVPTIETTDLASTAATFVSGVPDMGEVSFECMYDSADAVHAYLDALIATPSDTQLWKVLVNQASDQPNIFTGILTEWQLSDMVINNMVVKTGKIKVSGAVSFS